MNEEIKNKELIASGLSLAQTEEARIEDSRSKNRTVALVIVGTILGFALKEESLEFVIVMCCAAVTFTLLIWYQDYRYHKFRHGWQGIGRRIKKYIRGDIFIEELRFLEYDKKDEKKATFYCKSSSFVFVVLIVGSFALTIYKFITLTKSC